MPAYLNECPRCTSAVTPGTGICDRCHATFDPWVERPPKVAHLLGGDADSLERGLDFPTVARHLTEVNRLVDRQETSVQDLVAVIVRDLALTTRLLRVVNGPAYRQYNEPVATVTRAVILLGFEQVRRVALSLILYQRLRDHPRGGPLAGQVVLSFGAGLMARALLLESGEGDEILADEAFICAMYHRLGELSIEAYLPQDADEVAAQRLLPSAPPREDLQLQIVGCTATQFGASVARAFGLPHSVVWALRPAPVEPPGTPKSKAARLHLIAAFVNGTLQEASRPGGDVDAVTAHYAVALRLTVLKVRELLRMVAGQLKHHAYDLGLGPNEHPVVREVLNWAGPEGSQLSLTAAEGNIDPKVDRLEDFRRKTFLMQGRTELEAAVRQGAPVHEVLSLAIEALYRGFGFSHAALCLREVTRDTGRLDAGDSGESSSGARLAARIAFGPDALKLKKKLVFVVERNGDVFAQAVYDGMDVVVDHVVNAAQRGQRVPDWYTRQLSAKGFVLFPVRIQGRAVGLIYGDSDAPARCFQRNRFLHLREMRDLIEAALERHRRTLTT